LGYACASATYRRPPAYRFEQLVEDVRLAMARFRGRADELGFDAGQIGALGSSAGAHLVAMLATIGADDDLGVTDELREISQSLDTRPNAAICYCPVTVVQGLDTLADSIRGFMGTAESEDSDRYRAASPLCRVTGDEPPFLFVHGDADTTTPLDVHTRPMVEALRARGVKADLRILPGVDHGYGYGVSTDAQKASITCVAEFLGEVFAR
jgi:acetyl esterase/lipase